MQKHSGGQVCMLFVWSCLLQIISTNGVADLLFFATPGGRGLTAGFYGGEIDLRRGGYPKNIFKIGYDCMEIDSQSIENLLIKSVSLDLGSGAVILHIGSLTESSKVTLLRVPLCKRLAHAACDESLMIKPIFLNVQINKHEIVSFASFHDNIYFVSEKIQTDFSTNTKHKSIELRNLTGCGREVKIPYTANSAFYIQSCSTLIASLVEEDYNSNAQYYTTAGLAIVPTANGPVFYTQIQHFPPNRDKLNLGDLSNAFILMRISADGEKRLLHEEYVTAEHKRYIIQGLGQITYRKDLLCWTALDRIVCAKIDHRGTIYHATTIMQSGQARGICAASPNEPLISRIATGIAIAKVPRDINQDKIALFFGCIAQTRGLGGSGLVEKKGNSRANVHLLRSNLTTIYAGSMLVTDICSGGDQSPLYLMNRGTRLSCYYPVCVFLYALISLLSFILSV